MAATVAKILIDLKKISFNLESVKAWLKILLSVPKFTTESMNKSFGTLLVNFYIKACLVSDNRIWCMK